MELSITVHVHWAEILSEEDAIFSLKLRPGQILVECNNAWGGWKAGFFLTFYNSLSH
jgi:hypothetical protein